MTAQTTRDQIVQAADRLFYRQGFEHSSFSDIAGAVRISRGNFYYHFKTKDDILKAVIAARLTATRRMLDGWGAECARPADRIRNFIRMCMVNRVEIQRYGCPVGTLCSELAKVGHPAVDEARGLFNMFRSWLSEQFAALGREVDADALAMHLLARSQGVATLANAFHDEEFIEREVEQACAWVESLTSAGSGDA